MKRGKFEAQPVAKKNNGKKIVSLLLVLVLLLGTVIGTTLAWLVAGTNTINNTFTFGDIKISLVETAGAGNATDRNFKLAPGAKVAKDPIVTVEKGSEACWLFVEIETDNDTIDGIKILDWAIAEGWTPITEGSNIYYREQGAIAADGSDVTYQVLKGEDGVYEKGVVNVSDALTQTHIQEINTTGKNPVISITAYAIQSDSLGVETAAEAWQMLTNQLNG